MEERERFICDWWSDRFTMTELCSEYGISRKTGYKWLRRFQQEGRAGLQDRSRRPHSSPWQTEDRCVEALVAERQAHPLWGARKLLVRLRRRHPDWSWPAPSTATTILKRHGLVESRRRRPHREAIGRPDVDTEAANQVWTADFKGKFRLGNGKVCHPLTVVDHYSRYLLGCEAGALATYASARTAFEAIFEHHGLPRAILTDNGPPFAGYKAPRRLSRLAVWWIRLGIKPLLIQPGRPEQNGRHERMHRTLKAATARPPTAAMNLQQDAFDRFRREYNEQRPHEGIQFQMPAELYVDSLRPHPTRLPEVTYPPHFEVRIPDSRGRVSIHSQRFFVSEVFRDENVGFEEIDHGRWSIHFGPVLIGRYDEATNDVRFL